MNFLGRGPFLGPPLDVRKCSRIAAHAHHGNGVNVGRNFPRSVEVKFPTLFGR